MKHSALPVRGISAAEAARRLVLYGPNRMPEPGKAGLLQIFLGQLRSPFIYVLLAAALVSFGLNVVDELRKLWHNPARVAGREFEPLMSRHHPSRSP